MYTKMDCARNVPTGGDSSDEGTKIRLIGDINTKNSFSPANGGARTFRRGAIAP